MWYVTMIFHIQFIDAKQFMCIFKINMIALYVYTYIRLKNIQTMYV